jgi:hypothetical protein
MAARYLKVPFLFSPLHDVERGKTRLSSFFPAFDYPNNFFPLCPYFTRKPRINCFSNMAPVPNGIQIALRIIFEGNLVSVKEKGGSLFYGKNDFPRTFDL